MHYISLEGQSWGIHIFYPASPPPAPLPPFFNSYRPPSLKLFQHHHAEFGVNPSTIVGISESALRQTNVAIMAKIRGKRIMELSAPMLRGKRSVTGVHYVLVEIHE